MVGHVRGVVRSDPAPAGRAWWVSVAVLPLATLAFATADARAGLVIKSFEESKEKDRVKVVWGWDPEVTSSSKKDGDYWYVDLLIRELSGGYEVTGQFKHKVGLHPEDGGEGPAGTFNDGFDKNMLGKVIDKELIGPHGEHRDTGRLVFERARLPKDNKITLDVQHVPEPGTLVLAGIATLTGLTYARRCRRAVTPPG